MKPLIITVEGATCSGKTTVLSLIAQLLARVGYTVLTTDEDCTISVLDGEHWKGLLQSAEGVLKRFEAGEMDAAPVLLQTKDNQHVMMPQKLQALMMRKN